VGLDLLCSQDQDQIATALMVFETPSDGDEDLDNYREMVFFDDWSSSDNNYDASEEYCFVLQTHNYKMNPNTWLGDSAASTHMGFSDEGSMIDVKLINSPVIIGNGKPLTATKIGQRHITIIQKDGLSQDVILEECKCVPDLWENLFPISKSLQNSWDTSNKGINIKPLKGCSV
jgi:hypothetical protein